MGGRTEFALGFRSALIVLNPYLNHVFLSSCLIVISVRMCLLLVRQAREAALDAHLLVVATDLGKEKATQMFTGSAFDSTAFAEHLVSEFTVYTHTCMSTQRKSYSHPFYDQHIHMNSKSGIIGINSSSTTMCQCGQ